MRAEVAIIIPCYNEEARLRPGDVLALLGDPRVGIVFVNDGSSDGTQALLESLQHDAPDRIDVLALPHNQGKAEAVRAGLRRALDQDAAVVGYADADMATPASEVLRLLEALEPGVEAVIGARVAVLGADIQRKQTRHYLGRLFATFASLILQTPVYDTQCGAKLFRRSPRLEAALAEPFRSRWAFDVELLGRLIVRAGGYRNAGIVEVPLRRWIDADGSKVRPSQMIKAGLDLAVIARDLQRLRRDA